MSKMKLKRAAAVLAFLGLFLSAAVILARQTSYAETGLPQYSTEDKTHASLTDILPESTFTTPAAFHQTAALPEVLVSSVNTPSPVPSQPSTYQHYYGLLHGHTAYSDGSADPETAFVHARDKGKVDFYALTEHSEMLDNEFDWDRSSEWESLRKTADRFSENGSFIAIAGYEMTWEDGSGHINTFDTEGFETAHNAAMNLETYYKRLAETPGSIAQWNHPGDYLGYFRDFAYFSPSADKVINLIEASNGAGPINGDGYYRLFDYYIRALDKGWHVAPAFNQDNHGKDWATANDIRTVVLAPSLTRDHIFEAIRNKRVYATEDRNLRLEYSVNGEVMGSILSPPAALNVEVRVQDSDGQDRIKRVEMISEGGKVVASREFDSSEVEWQLELQPEYRYYFVKVSQADRNYALSAPVWIEK